MSEHNHKSINILIIDDDQDLREIIKLLLEAENFGVYLAGNGQEAIDLLKNLDFAKQIDLILLDLMMPIMDGFHFLQWLRQETNLTMPVLVLSARKTPHTLEQVLAAGGTALVYKPLEAPELIQQVKQVLNIL